MNDIKVAIFEYDKHLLESLYYLANAMPGFICIRVYPDSNDAEFKLQKIRWM